MLSCFAYRRVLQHLRAAAFRAGVEVLPVIRHPAYTSTIGAVNYAARFGISIHQGAAIAIARRGLALSERPAVRVAQLSTRQGGHVTFPLPEWNRGQQGRRSPDRCERRWRHLFSCFPPWREVDPRLGISRRRVLPEQCMVGPSTPIVANAVI